MESPSTLGKARTANTNREVLVFILVSILLASMVCVALKIQKRVRQLQVMAAGKSFERQSRSKKICVHAC
jgi:hypothetical protein